MTGDYAKDTISVVKTLQTAVDTPKDSPNKDEVRSTDKLLETFISESEIMYNKKAWGLFFLGAKLC